jgi:hypothetical protein
MTMPNERTRALRWAGEFLREVSTSHEVSDVLKKEAVVILRHYPSALEIKHQAQYSADKTDIVGSWLEPEEWRGS